MVTCNIEYRSRMELMYEMVFTTHKPLMNGEPGLTSMSLGTQIISLIIQNFDIFLFDKSRRLCSVTLFYPRHVYSWIISLQISPQKCGPCLEFINPLKRVGMSSVENVSSRSFLLQMRGNLFKDSYLKDQCHKIVFKFFLNKKKTLLHFCKLFLFDCSNYDL